LHGDVLEVGRTGVEQQRQLTIVDRNLREHRAERTEPECRSGAGVGDFAVAHVLDVRGRCSAQVSDEWVACDVRHVNHLFLIIVMLTISLPTAYRQHDDKRGTVAA
jgi:hypothetical protein